MAEEKTAAWVELAPLIASKDAKARAVLRWVARKLTATAPNGSESATIDSVRSAVSTRAQEFAPKIAIPLAFCASVFCDLRAQGWWFRTTSRRILARAPTNGQAVEDEKSRVRTAHLIERNAQLRQPAVRRFVREMERRRLYKHEWHSVFSLMRDGRELSSQLKQAANLAPGAAREQALRLAVDPYIQVVRAGITCEFTGLDLADIWRYFRHTWITTYQSTPGRKLFFLIRDRAAVNHPIIGIAALGSPIVQLSVRDGWIGWTPQQLVQTIRESPSTHWLTWMHDSIAQLIRGVYVRDFLRERRFRRKDLRRPTQMMIDKLRTLAVNERRVHQLYPARRQHKTVSRTQTEIDWVQQARTHLFRSKRATALAELLTARRDLQEAGLNRSSTKQWHEVVASSPVTRAIGIVLRYTKASHVGVDMMDITVCGAVAPYNRILGGKLVSLLMASPEVRSEYGRRYKTMASIIASSMAGRAVVRRPRLVMLGTTSLYGVGASQYNRLKIPPGWLGRSRESSVAYELLGRTAGFGSFHFSQETMSALDPLLGRLQHGRPVNSIFGEGVNPKLRKVRTALDAVGLPANLLLQHGSPRLVYGVALAKNFREVLFGLHDRPRYLVPNDREMTSQIAEFWRSRWLSGRIQRQDILDALLRESLVYPVAHGARVVLPDCATEDLPLFPPEQDCSQTTGRIGGAPNLPLTSAAAADSRESDASQSVETTYPDSDLALAFARS